MKFVRKYFEKKVKFMCVREVSNSWECDKNKSSHQGM